MSASWTYGRFHDQRTFDKGNWTLRSPGGCADAQCCKITWLEELQFQRLFNDFLVRWWRQRISKYPFQNVSEEVHRSIACLALLWWRFMLLEIVVQEDLFMFARCTFRMIVGISRGIDMLANWWFVFICKILASSSGPPRGNKGWRFTAGYKFMRHLLNPVRAEHAFPPTKGV